tara:strand:+ start:664 stop:2961 length:2298 start_codon:yes stop_codon:yes gene_type:complete
MPYSEDKYTSSNVNYLNKDFITLKNNLIEYAKTYFPNTYQDFNETSTGMMLIEMGAYVGDVLSFYIDQQYKEMLLPLAEERRNITNIAKMLGYQVKPTIPSHTDVIVTQTVAADLTDLNNIKPNYEEALIIDEGMKLLSTNNSSLVFETLEEIDFTVSSSDFKPVEYSFNDSTNLVSSYKLTRKVKVVSGETKTTSFTVSSPEKFLELTLTENDVIEILNVVDSNNNRYYEVEYLAQDKVPIGTHYTDDWVDGSYAEGTSARSSAYITEDGYIVNVPTPYTLEYLKTGKRFIIKINDDNTTTLVFGGGLLRGSRIEETRLLQTDQAGIVIPGETQNALTDAIDPLSADASSTLGETPANTTLTVTYRVGGGINSNTTGGDIASIHSKTILNGVSDSGKNLSVINITPAMGGADEQTVEEIRNNALSFFATQNRCVTKEDYEARVLNMPSKFGSIAKVYAEKAPYSVEGIEVSPTEASIGPDLGNILGSVSSYITAYHIAVASGDPLPVPEQFFDFTENGLIDFQDNNFVQSAYNDIDIEGGEATVTNAEIITNVNLYLLGYDNQKRLVTYPEPSSNISHPIKTNLKEYLNQYRILTDEINLLDGKVINFGVAFKVYAERDANKQDVKIKCINTIIDYFNVDKMQFRQPIYTSNLQYQLMGLEGVRGLDYVELTQNFNQLSNGNSLKLDSNTLLFDNQYDGDGGIITYSAGSTDGMGNSHSGQYGWLYNFRQFYEGESGGGVILPSFDPSVFELKNPNKNIRGIVV